MKVLFAFLFIVPFFLLGCTGEGTPGGDLIPSPITDAVPLNIKSVMVNTDTRVTTLDDPGMSIGVYRIDETYSGANKYNREYKLALNYELFWTPHNLDDKIDFMEDDARVCAYYPYDPDPSHSCGTIDVPAARYLFASGSLANKGLYYACARNVNYRNASLSFEMVPAHAKLAIKVMRDGYLGSEKITSIDLENLPTRGKFSISNGGLYDVEYTSSVIRAEIKWPAPVPPKPDYALLQTNILLLPGALQADVKITINFEGNNNKMVTTIPLHHYYLRAGHVTTIPIKLKKPNF